MFIVFLNIYEFTQKVFDIKTDDFQTTIKYMVMKHCNKLYIFQFYIFICPCEAVGIL